MNLVLDQGNNFYLIYLSTLITCLLDSGWILLGEVMCESLLGVKGLTCFHCILSCYKVKSSRFISYFSNSIWRNELLICNFEFVTELYGCFMLRVL